MKLIPLSHNQFSKVDDDVFDWLSEWKWEYSKKKGENTGYARRRPMKKGKRISILMHREILGLKKGDLIQCDHIDGDGLNNQRKNLRKCTHAQNQWNTSPRNARENKGVYWEKSHKSWKVCMRIDGKSKNLGRFKNKNDALLAYNKIGTFIYD